MKQHVVSHKINNDSDDREVIFNVITDDQEENISEKMIELIAWATKLEQQLRQDAETASNNAKLRVKKSCELCNKSTGNIIFAQVQHPGAWDKYKLLCFKCILLAPESTYAITKREV